MLVSIFTAIGIVCCFLMAFVLLGMFSIAIKTKVSDVPIVTSNKLSFDASIINGKLFFPSEMAKIAESLRLYTARSFLSYVRAFPMEIGNRLGWSVSDVVEATNELVILLSSIMTEESLSVKERPKVTFGANKP